MKKDFTLTVFTENQRGLVIRIASVITKRHINIESLSVSKSSMQGIHRFTIVVHEEDEVVRKLCAQLDKQVDVLKAFYYSNDEIVYQEIALYKVPIEAFFHGEKLEKIVRDHNARILSIEEEYIVIEKTGYENETEALLKALRSIGIYEFVRSGRVAIVKPMERLNKYLKSLNIKMSNSN